MDEYTRALYVALAAWGGIQYKDDDDLIDYCLGDGCYSLLYPIHSFDIEEIVEYMRERVTIDSIPEYLQICNLTMDILEILSCNDVDNVDESLPRSLWEIRCTYSHIAKAPTIMAEMFNIVVFRDYKPLHQEILAVIQQMEHPISMKTVDNVCSMMRAAFALLDSHRIDHSVMRFIDGT